MTLFTLVIVLWGGNGVAAVSIPNYPTGAACVAAGHIAEKLERVSGWTCVPSYTLKEAH